MASCGTVAASISAQQNAWPTIPCFRLRCCLPAVPFQRRLEVTIDLLFIIIAAGNYFGNYGLISGGGCTVKVLTDKTTAIPFLFIVYLVKWAH